eukprot:767210-Hanusia_phi.AAC.1
MNVCPPLKLLCLQFSQTEPRHSLTFVSWKSNNASDRTQTVKYPGPLLLGLSQLDLVGPVGIFRSVRPRPLSLSVSCVLARVRSESTLPRATVLPAANVSAAVWLTSHWHVRYRVPGRDAGRSTVVDASHRARPVAPSEFGSSGSSSTYGDRAAASLNFGKTSAITVTRPPPAYRARRTFPEPGTVRAAVTAGSPITPSLPYGDSLCHRARARYRTRAVTVRSRCTVLVPAHCPACVSDLPGPGARGAAARGGRSARFPKFEAFRSDRVGT